MALSVQADLSLSIDGQSAHLSGSGRTLTLTLENPTMLRKMLQVPLPKLAKAGGKERKLTSIPKLLERMGLTLNIADDKGTLLILGEAAAGKSYTLPFVGKLENVALASKRAALRLVFNA